MNARHRDPRGDAARPSPVPAPGDLAGLAPAPASASASASAAGDPRPTVLRCFNVKYSPNLGDGLLSECLEKALVDGGADPRTASVDLAARRAFGEAMPARGAALRLLQALPPALRRPAVRLPLMIQARRRWGPHYRAGLEGADGVVIGGGNLVSDLDLNFPTKLPLAIAEAERRGLPAAIYACGVGAAWSPTGLAWCRAAFARPNLRAVFVRDGDSKASWDALMARASGHEAEVVRDPGLLACDLYPAPPRAASSRPERGGGRPVAGLGIISHVALGYHAERAPAARHLARWYVEVARGLIARGFEVRVFTNGSPEDRAYAAQLHGRLRALGGEDEIAFLSQRDPAGLCAHIRDFDVLLAHRMHAVIAAYSFGVPALALAWDRKLRAFMRSVGREAHLADIAETGPEACVARVLAAWREGIPEAERSAAVAEARADVARLWRVFAAGDRR